VRLYFEAIQFFRSGHNQSSSPATTHQNANTIKA
jgi:hypothetical protein